MFQSLFKLGCAAAAVLGPFGAGTALFVTVPEAQIFFVAAGCGLGLAGLFGFAAQDRDEAVRHVRTIRGER